MGVRSFKTASISTGAKRSKFWDQSAAIANGVYESIATYTLSTSTSTVTFSSIPSTYTHLEIRSIAKDTGNANGSFNLRARFNSDSGSNYPLHRLYGTGSSASADTFAQTSAVVGNVPANGFTSVYGVGVCQILDYASTNKYKTVRTLSAADTNAGDKYVFFTNNLWTNTSAITSITLLTDATSLAQYSHFALYGIRGA